MLSQLWVGHNCGHVLLKLLRLMMVHRALTLNSSKSSNATLMLALLTAAYLTGSCTVVAVPHAVAVINNWFDMLKLRQRMEALLAQTLLPIRVATLIRAPLTARCQLGHMIPRAAISLVVVEI